MSRRDLDFLLFEWLRHRGAVGPARGSRATSRRPSRRPGRWPRPWPRVTSHPTTAPPTSTSPASTATSSRSSRRSAPHCVPSPTRGSSRHRWTRRSEEPSCPVRVRRRDVVVPRGQRRDDRVRAADDGRGQPAGHPRLRGPGAALRPADARGAVLRHHGAVGVPGRLQPGRHHDPGRAAGGRHLPPVRPQDVDLRRRPRSQREHRAPGPRPHHRGAGGDAWRSRCSWSPSTSSRRTAAWASTTTSRWQGSTTRWATAARSTPLPSSVTARTRPADGPARSATSSGPSTGACP